MNILLTGAARRNFLIPYFKAALGPSGRLLACEANPNAPVLAEADEGILVPPMDDPGYLDALLAICRDRQVSIVIPLNNLDVPVIAGNAAAFRALGTIPLTPSAEMSAMCADKWDCYEWLREHEIATPATYPTLDAARSALARGELHFPVFVKPRWGTSSLAVERAGNERELELACEWGKVVLRRTILSKMTKSEADDAFVFQQAVEGQECGMDVVNDLDGHYAATLARRKLAMRDGNTDRAVTVAGSHFEELGQKLGALIRHAGVVDCDLIETPEGLFVIDLNPRLGGGYPFSHMAGADLPAALVAWASGRTPEPSCFHYQTDVLSARFDGVMTLRRPETVAAHPALFTPIQHTIHA